MTAAPAPAAATGDSFYEQRYDPARVLKHPAFRVLAEDDPLLKDKNANIACAYNPAHEVHMIAKPDVVPRDGEVVVHVKATGICG